VSTSTGRWSKLSAYHEVRYIADGIFLVITMSETSEGSDGVLLIGGLGEGTKDQTAVLVGIIM